MESMVGNKATVVVEGSIVAAAEAAVVDVAAVVGYVLARTWVRQLDYASHLVYVCWSEEV